MTDGCGKPLAIGARVKWPWNADLDIDDEDYLSDSGTKELTGTVRRLRRDDHRGHLVLVDDGNPEDPDLLTNKYTHSSWVYAADIEVIPCNANA